MKKTFLILVFLILQACNKDSTGKRIHVIKSSRIDCVTYAEKFDRGLIKIEKKAKENPEKFEETYQKLMRVKNSTLALETLVNAVIDEGEKKGVSLSNIKDLTNNEFGKLINDKVINLIRLEVKKIHDIDYKYFKGHVGIQAHLKRNFSYDNYLDNHGQKADYYKSLQKMNSIQILSDLEFMRYNCAKYKYIAVSDLIDPKQK